jgi:hypothetical protein
MPGKNGIRAGWISIQILFLYNLFNTHRENESIAIYLCFYQTNNLLHDRLNSQSATIVYF